MTMSSIKSGFLTVVATGVVAGAVAYSGLIKSDIIEKSLLPGTASAKVEEPNVFKEPVVATEKPAAVANAPVVEDKALLAKKPIEIPKLSEIPTPNVMPVAVKTSPAFDVLRVTQDGSILIAGRASANSEIQVLNEDGAVVASSTSGPAGDFVATPKEPLKPGDYALTIVAKPASGESTSSKETGIVRVPSPGQDALAMVSPNEAPSRIVVKPTTFGAVPLEEGASIQKNVLKSAPPIDGDKSELKPDSAETGAETSVNKADKPQDVAKAEVPSPKTVIPKLRPETPTVKPKLDVVVEAVELDDGKIYIAGAAPKGAAIRIYINNEPVGIARGTINNRFLLTRTFKLKAGNHQVRADLVDRQSGKVLSRAEVPLIHTIEEVVKEVFVEQPKRSEPVVTESKKKPELEVEIPLDPIAPKPVETSAADSPAPVKTGTTIIIKPGDNLWRISRRTYGRGIRYTTIYNANRDQIRNPSRIYVGQIFKIPAEEQSTSIE